MIREIVISIEIRFCLLLARFGAIIKNFISRLTHQRFGESSMDGDDPGSENRDNQT